MSTLVLVRGVPVKQMLVASPQVAVTAPANIPVPRSRTRGHADRIGATSYGVSVRRSCHDSFAAAPPGATTTQLRGRRERVGGTESAISISRFAKLRYVSIGSAGARDIMHFVGLVEPSRFANGLFAGSYHYSLR